MFFFLLNNLNYLMCLHLVKKKILFNRSISSILKWKEKKEDKTIVKRKKLKFFYPNLSLIIRKSFNYAKNAFKKPLTNFVKRNHLTFFQSLNIINKIRGNILIRRKILRIQKNPEKNFFLQKLYWGIAILFFLLKVQ